MHIDKNKQKYLNKSFSHIHTEKSRFFPFGSDSFHACMMVSLVCAKIHKIQLNKLHFNEIPSQWILEGGEIVPTYAKNI